MTIKFLEQSSNSLAEDHPHRLASQHTLAGAYRADGQVGKAVKLLEHAVAVREKVLAEDHPSRLGVAARARSGIRSRRTGGQGGRAA
jgi:hypothetical protein